MQYTGSGVYYGEYKKGRRSGAGILQGANGDRIEGTFVSKTRQVTRAMCTMEVLRPFFFARVFREGF